MRALQYLKSAWHRSLFTSDAGGVTEFGVYLLIALLSIAVAAITLFFEGHWRGAIVALLVGGAVFLYARLCYMNTPGNKNRVVTRSRDSK